MIGVRNTNGPKAEEFDERSDHANQPRAYNRSCNERLNEQRNEHHRVNQLEALRKKMLQRTIVKTGFASCLHYARGAHRFPHNGNAATIVTCI